MDLINLVPRGRGLRGCSDLIPKRRILRNHKDFHPMYPKP